MEYDSNLIQIKIATYTMWFTFGAALFAGTLVLLGFQLSIAGIEASTSTGLISNYLSALQLVSNHSYSFTNDSIVSNSIHNRILLIMNSTGSSLSSITNNSNNLSSLTSIVGIIFLALGLGMMLVSGLYLYKLRNEYRNMLEYRRKLKEQSQQQKE